MDKITILRWLLVVLVWLSLTAGIQVESNDELSGDLKMDLANDRTEEFPLAMDRNLQKLAELAYKRRQEIKRKVVSFFDLN